MPDTVPDARRRRPSPRREAKRAGGEILYHRKPFRDFRVLPRGGREEG
jgi:hypothetical protein